MDRLSYREKEILDLMIQGLTNAQIAQKAVITEETVKAHLKSIYRKLNVQNRIQAVLYVLKK